MVVKTNVRIHRSIRRCVREAASGRMMNYRSGPIPEARSTLLWGPVRDEPCKTMYFAVRNGKYAPHGEYSKKRSGEDFRGIQ